MIPEQAGPSPVTTVVRFGRPKVSVHKDGACVAVHLSDPDTLGTQTTLIFLIRDWLQVLGDLIDGTDHVMGQERMASVGIARVARVNGVMDE